MNLRQRVSWHGSRPVAGAGCLSDSFSRDLSTSAYGSMGIIVTSSAPSVYAGVYDGRTRAFENFECPESLDRTNVPLKRGE